MQKTALHKNILLALVFHYQQSFKQTSRCLMHVFFKLTVLSPLGLSSSQRIAVVTSFVVTTYCCRQDFRCHNTLLSSRLPSSQHTAVVTPHCCHQGFRRHTTLLPSGLLLSQHTTAVRTFVVTTHCCRHNTLLSSGLSSSQHTSVVRSFVVTTHCGRLVFRRHNTLRPSGLSHTVERYPWRCQLSQTLPVQSLQT